MPKKRARPLLLENATCPAQGLGTCTAPTSPANGRAVLNIARHTEGRFEPKGFATRTEALREPAIAKICKLDLAPEVADEPALLLMTDEDLTPDWITGLWPARSLRATRTWDSLARVASGQLAFAKLCSMAGVDVVLTRHTPLGQRPSTSFRVICVPGSLWCSLAGRPGTLPSGLMHNRAFAVAQSLSQGLA